MDLKYLCTCIALASLAVMRVCTAEEDTGCKARNVMISSGANMDPPLVWVKRCTGMNQGATLSKHVCVAISKSKVMKTFYDEFGGSIDKPFENHETCEVKTCSKDLLGCDKLGKTFDETYCRCTCDGVPTSATVDDGDDKTPKSTVSMKLFIIALVSELGIVLLILFVVRDFCRCRRHKRGVIYRTSVSIMRHLSTAHTGHDKGSKDTTDAVLERQIRDVTVNLRNKGSVSFLDDDPFEA